MFQGGADLDPEPASLLRLAARSSSHLCVPPSLLHCLLPFDVPFLFSRLLAFRGLSFPFPSYVSALGLSPVVKGMAQSSRALTCASGWKQTVHWAVGGKSGGLWPRQLGQVAGGVSLSPAAHWPYDLG